MVCSRAFIGVQLVPQTCEFVLARVQIWNPSYPFAQFKFSVYGYEQTYTHVLQCSSTSVGLAQARPYHSFVADAVVIHVEKYSLEVIILTKHLNISTCQGVHY